ncbi:MAG: hypothetical protein US89_C0001G0044 [Candidatus Peregrinibacteria bacterium GW2011_GWF2_38_29]|nr:MAG: hypothetical protein US89_C0001G0044 [Candidatus Peregrinibacteria bacterium GW2011_GWF2_38_29]HBB03079.1 hypothetical protein [Candidatus Peregrinibacteria bacterium]
MVKIIPTTKVQQNIGGISATIGQDLYIVTNRGEGRIVMLPYFDGCDEHFNEYMEDYVMSKNKEVLKKRYQKSSDSKKSALTV